MKINERKYIMEIKKLSIIIACISIAACSSDPSGDVSESKRDNNLTTGDTETKPPILKRKTQAQERAFSLYRTVYSQSQSQVLQESQFLETLPCFLIAMQNSHNADVSEVLPQIESCMNSAFAWRRIRQQEFKNDPYSTVYDEFRSENKKWIPLLLSRGLPKGVPSRSVLEILGMLYEAQRSAFHREAIFLSKVFENQGMKLSALAPSILSFVFYHGNREDTVLEYGELYLGTIFSRINELSNYVTIKSPESSPSQWMPFQNKIVLSPAFDALFKYLQKDKPVDVKVNLLIQKLTLKKDSIEEYFEDAIYEISSLQERLKSEDNTSLEAREILYRKIRKKEEETGKAIRTYMVFLEDKDPKKSKELKTRLEGLLTIYKNISDLFAEKKSPEEVVSGIAHAALSIISLIKGDSYLGFFGNRAILDNLMKIQEKIKELREEIHERFNLISDQLDEINELILKSIDVNQENFSDIKIALNKIIKENRSIKFIGMEGFKHTLTQPYDNKEEVCFVALSASKEESQELPRNILYECLGSFSSRATHLSKNPLISGKTYEENWDNLFYKKPEEIFGLLPTLIRKYNSNFHIKDLPHPGEWAKGVQNYLSFALETKTRINSEVLGSMKEEGKKLIDTLGELRNENFLNMIISDTKWNMKEILENIKSEITLFESKNLKGNEFLLLKNQDLKKIDTVRLALALGLVKEKISVDVWFTVEGMGNKRYYANSANHISGRHYLQWHAVRAIHIMDKDGSSLGVHRKRYYTGRKYGTSIGVSSSRNEDVERTSWSRWNFRKEAGRVREYVKNYSSNGKITPVDTAELEELVYAMVIMEKERMHRKIALDFTRKFSMEEGKKIKMIQNRLLAKFIVSSTYPQNKQGLMEAKEVFQVLMSPLELQEKLLESKDYHDLESKMHIPTEVLKLPKDTLNLDSFLYTVQNQIEAMEYWIP